MLVIGCPRSFEAIVFKSPRSVLKAIAARELRGVKPARHIFHLPRCPYATSHKIRRLQGRHNLRQDLARSHDTHQSSESSQGRDANRKYDAEKDEFRQSISQHDWPNVRRLYSSLISRKSSPLFDDDAHLLIWTLERQVFPLDDVDHARAFPLDFVKVIERDIRAGKISVRPLSLALILRIYSRLRCFNDFDTFWAWLLIQSPAKRTSAVWTEVMDGHLRKGASLSVIQSSFESALGEIKQDFIAYRAAPNALVPDRSILMPPARDKEYTQLLSFLMRAQFEAGKRRDAYLTMDTMWRTEIGNGIKPRHVAIFPLQTSSETYCLFTILVRSGVKLSWIQVEKATKAIKQWKLGDMEELDPATRLARFEIEAAAIGSGALIHDQVSFSLYNGLNYIIKYALYGDLETARDMNPLLIETLEAAFRAFQVTGFVPASGLWYLTAAAYLKSKTSYEFLKRNIAREAFWETEKATLMTMRAAALSGDETLLADSWLELLRQCDPGENEWRALTYACRACKMESFLKEQIVACFAANENDLSTGIQAAIAEAFRGSMEHWASLGESRREVEPMTGTEYQYLLLRMKDLFEDMQQRKLRNFFKEPLATSLNGERIRASEEIWLRVYDRVTRDPREPLRTREELDVIPQEPVNEVQEDQVASTDGALQNDTQNDMQSTPRTARSKSANRRGRGVPITSTGYRIDDLRYANWRTMNELILEGCLLDGLDLGDEGLLIKSGENLNEDELLGVIMKIRGIRQDQLPKLPELSTPCIVKQAAIAPGRLFQGSPTPRQRAGNISLRPPHTGRQKEVALSRMDDYIKQKGDDPEN